MPSLRWKIDPIVPLTVLLDFALFFSLLSYRLHPDPRPRISLSDGSFDSELQRIPRLQRIKEEGRTARQQSLSLSSATASSSSVYLVTPPGASLMPPITARSFYAKEARKLHPDLTPENDFQIMALGSNRLENYTTAAKLEWLEEEWTDTCLEYGSVEAAEAGIQKSMDQMVEPTGEKPEPGDPDIRYIQIPNTDLSLRFWPGSASAMEYCMDFVDTATKAPLNVPDGYEFWTVPTPATAWFEPAPRRLVSLERSHGIPQDKIEKGEEKFILTDGLFCEMVHNGRKILRFRVPTRPRVIAEGELEILQATPM